MFTIIAKKKLEVNTIIVAFNIQIYIKTSYARCGRHYIFEERIGVWQ